MLVARKQCPDIGDYASDRVFNGTRPLSADRVAKLRANYDRTHTTIIYRFVMRQVSRLRSFGAAHHVR